MLVCVNEPGPAVPDAMFGEGFSTLEVTVVIEPRPFMVDFTTASSSALSRINKSMGMGLNHQQLTTHIRGRILTSLETSYFSYLSPPAASLWVTGLASTM